MSWHFHNFWTNTYQIHLFEGLRLPYFKVFPECSFIKSKRPQPKPPVTDLSFSHCSGANCHRHHTCKKKDPDSESQAPY